jgi:16S rRNA (uracil1498-N3)-methyltransferase
MRIPRLLVEFPISGIGDIVLSDDRAHYVSRVLRLKVGAALVVADGRGGEYVGELRRVDRREVVVSLLEHRVVECESPINVNLVLGLSKGDRMDFAVQKAVELGAATVTPVWTARSVVKLDEERARKRQAHWMEIARSACEQCGRNMLPTIAVPTSFTDWLATRNDALGFILAPQAPVGLYGISVGSGSEVNLAVGPEGGFEAVEIEDAVAAGMTPVTLGPRVLRTETAAIAALCAAQLLWGDLLATPPT